MWGLRKPFPELTTERFVLRELENKDARDLFKILSDEDVMYYYGSDPLATVYEAKNVISYFKEQFTQGKAIRWAIADLQTNQLIGTIGFHNWLAQYHRAEIGFEVSQDYWKQGVASEAARAVLTHGFEDFALHRISALVAPENLASNALVQKLGFQSEGLLEDYAYSHGRFMDLTIYRMLASEWKG
ncbi:MULTISPECIES: GNAT family protein [Exiguobacterium]|uniref:N-acetyltransferase n=1 Tax=Exiguobacterium oxidotolerans TaxID=223958 RepID=A0A653ICG7_9BACL|nr:MULTISPECIES: GNAT family protein [Exiguobacterium]ASI35888.1 N-acetyltransferase [Exiguobacterium sp. N4-1P]VWX36739.1 N-acetyltransferase [Exiguobacterium oxidotolerans]